MCLRPKQSSESVTGPWLVSSTLAPPPKFRGPRLGLTQCPQQSFQIGHQPGDEVTITGFRLHLWSPLP